MAKRWIRLPLLGTVEESMTLSEVIPQWKQFIHDRGRAARTVERYAEVVEQFLVHQELSEFQPEQVQIGHIATFVNPANSPIKASTRSQRWCAVNSFLDYCNRAGLCHANLARAVCVQMDKLTHDQKEKKRALPFTDDEIERMLKRVTRYEFWHAAITIGYCVGLRIGDICKLEWDSIESLNPVQFAVWLDKTNRRVVPHILEPARLVTAIDGLPLQDSRFVFPKQCRMMDTKRRIEIATQFTEIAHQAGITGKSFHGLRHTYATQCASLGIPTPHIRMAMGHTSEQMTERYIHRQYANA